VKERFFCYRLIWVVLDKWPLNGLLLGRIAVLNYVRRCCLLLPTE